MPNLKRRAVRDLLNWRKGQENLYYRESFAGLIVGTNLQRNGDRDIGLIPVRQIRAYLKRRDKEDK